MLAHELGVLCAPPGFGKTVIAAHVIAARSRSTLVVVNSKPLLEQWVQRLTEFLDLDVKQIGVIGAGSNEPTGRLDVATVQSLARREHLQELLADYGHIVVDECHHVPALTTERVLQSAPARHVTGRPGRASNRSRHSGDLRCARHRRAAGRADRQGHDPTDRRRTFADHPHRATRAPAAARRPPTRLHPGADRTARRHAPPRTTSRYRAAHHHQRGHGARGACYRPLHRRGL